MEKDTKPSNPQAASISTRHARPPKRRKYVAAGIVSAALADVRLGAGDSVLTNCAWASQPMRFMQDMRWASTPSQIKADIGRHCNVLIWNPDVSVKQYEPQFLLERESLKSQFSFIFQAEGAKSARQRRQIRAGIRNHSESAWGRGATRLPICKCSMNIC